jgi:hypothetical protein
VGMVRVLCLVLPVALSVGQIQAQELGSMGNTFYLGGGKTNSTDSFANDDMPFSVGFMHQSSDSKLVTGFDFAGEGTMLDSTWGLDDAPMQGLSFNFLLGSNLIDDGKFRADAALLLGLRETSADCPDSYLGYQCYADADPTIEYKANFGAVITVSINRMTLGLRATQESTQLLAGVRF